MNKRYRLPEPDSFQAVYILKDGRILKAMAPPKNYETIFPSWEIDDESMKILLENGITPTLIKDKDHGKHSSPLHRR